VESRDHAIIGFYWLPHYLVDNSLFSSCHMSKIPFDRLLRDNECDIRKQCSSFQLASACFQVLVKIQFVFTSM